MKRVIWFSIACAGSLGCNMLSPPASEEKVVKTVDSRPAFRPPVVAGQLTPTNALEKAQALNEELDRDLQAAIEARDQGK
jgi:hypothetical protein